jgi:hypothetical protein
MGSQDEEKRDEVCDGQCRHMLVVVMDLLMLAIGGRQEIDAMQTHAAFFFFFFFFLQGGIRDWKIIVGGFGRSLFTSKKRKIPLLLWVGSQCSLL